MCQTQSYRWFWNNFRFFVKDVFVVRQKVIYKQKASFYENKAASKCLLFLRKISFRFHFVWWGSACAFGFIWRKKNVCFNLCYGEFSSFSWIGVLLCFCFFHLYIAFVYCIWVVDFFFQRGCCILYLFMTIFKCLFYMAVSTSLIWCYFNHGHNILRLFDGSPNFPFATS